MQMMQILEGLQRRKFFKELEVGWVQDCIIYKTIMANIFAIGAQWDFTFLI